MDEPPAGRRRFVPLGKQADIVDDAGGGGTSNIVPYLPLNELMNKSNNKSGESN